MSRSVLLVAAAALLSGCAVLSSPGVDHAEKSAFERPLSSPIAPAMAPRQEDWSSFEIRHFASGERETVEVSTFGSSGIRGRFPDGCVWTRQADWFSPSDSWAFCGESDVWRTAQAKVVRTGALWPLEVGATAQYVRDARSSKTGAVSRRTTTCAVIDAVEVLRSAGVREPAFKVRCDDGRRVRTTWWSPTSGLLVYRQQHRSRGVERFWERLPG